jgi:hypothetical protein
MTGKLRRAARVDSNQKQIVRELRAMGFQVDIVSQLKRLYDLVVTGRYDRGVRVGEIRTVRIEVKMPGEDLTIAEKEYHDRNAYPETLLIAYCTDDILQWFGRV